MLTLFIKFITVACRRLILYTTAVSYKH